MITAQPDGSAMLDNAFDTGNAALHNPGPMANNPDLVIERMTIDPPEPEPDQEVTITILVKNVGTATSNGFQTYLYVDSAERPPLVTTPDTNSFGWFLGLAPGTTVEWSSTYTFATGGCDHAIYAWVDRDNVVPEADETNNLTGFPLCIGGSDDIYEPDNRCEMARDIPTDGTRQTHLFELPDDQDWVKLTVKSGSTVTMTADKSATGVSPEIALYASCSATYTDPVAQGSQIRLTAAQNQTYYARVTNQNSERYGSDAQYDLSVTLTTCASDTFEEDDTSTTAHAVAADGTSTTHTSCPAGDQDWVRFAAQAGNIYVIETTNLEHAADTVLSLYDIDGVTELARNDDYGYSRASRIVWQATADGTYKVRVHHNDPNASGNDTRYDLLITSGHCVPDSFEPDNGPGDAPVLEVNAPPQEHNFCPDARRTDVSDQDWVRFTAQPAATYQIQTANLSMNSDTVIRIYDQDATTVLATNDDYAPGQASVIRFTPETAGTYYIQVTHFNGTLFGTDTAYRLAIQATITPTPTPPASRTTVPAPAQTATPTPTDIKTLILVNRQRIADLYGDASATALMNKLSALANHSRVQGSIIQLEKNTSVAAAYSDWTTNQTTLLSVDKANNVASAIRNRTLAALEQHPNVEYIVIVGSDLVLPHRRVADGIRKKTESEYADKVTADTPLQVALQANMILTDDYYADKEPTQNGGHEFYVPDYALGRLIEHPDDMIALIDTFLADSSMDGKQVLVTGYDFVQDGGLIIKRLFQNDGFTTDDTLIGASWLGDNLRNKLLHATPRFDVQSINGHSTHTSILTPNGDNIAAEQIGSATSNLAGSLIFNVGCHAGLNDPGTQDLPQSFIQQQATYIGNTGFGWGGSGVVFSEAVMRTFAYRLLLGPANSPGNALREAKLNYSNQATKIGPYDEKSLMQVTLYGLPMYQFASGATLTPIETFPDVQVNTSTTARLRADTESVTTKGQFEYKLSRSFATFGTDSTSAGDILTLNDSVHTAANEPVQPLFFYDLSVPQEGDLKGLLFLGGVYTEVQRFDPVVVLPFNEYITSREEPAFSTDGWHPAVPFAIRAGSTTHTADNTIATVLGQYNSAEGTERIYDRMSFETYYSNSADSDPPTVIHLDGVLNPATGTASIKVEAEDASGVTRVVVAYTDGQGQWLSHDLTYNKSVHKWSGTLTATAATHYFIQVVDGAGNIAVNDNKGRYHQPAVPLPLLQGRLLNQPRVYLPLLAR